MAGIYIHIPFCRQACTYCNFHFSTSLAKKTALVHAIIKEAILQKHFIKENIDSIYFGGGTPSLLKDSELQMLMNSLLDNFEINKHAEITLEANPDDVTRDNIIQWKRTGINRLSLGVQSFNDEELTWMNRSHSAAQSLYCIDLVKKEFENFSIDLIYGSPLLSNEVLKKHIEIIAGNHIPHVSCYALTVEPKTMLDKMVREKKTCPTDNDKQGGQFLLVMDLLEQAGYEHYEISNFAQPGFRSIHNSNYWKGIPYIGLGPSAHSYDGKNIRRWNKANNELYIQSLEKNNIPFQEEILSPGQQLNEYVMISLRTSEGINLEDVSKVFGQSIAGELKNKSQKYINAGSMHFKNGQLVLSREGKLLADGIAADLFI